MIPNSTPYASHCDAPQGGPFLSNECVMNHIPYLELDDQITFLCEHDLIDHTPLSEQDLQWLSTVNFHYLLGYACNLRTLCNEKIVPEQRTVPRLKRLIDTEAHFAAFLTPWLRLAEWNLRNLTVKHFCSPRKHGEGYLDTSNWSGEHQQGGHSKLQAKMLDSIQRHGEPYTVKALAEAANALNVKVPRQFVPSDKDLWLSLTQNLPLWAVVDSFSIGTLGKFIMVCGDNSAECKPGQDPTLVWKLISADLGIGAQRFSQTIDAFGVFRNMTFHHQRLWMRPMAKSPGLPKALGRKYQEFDLQRRNKQAQLVMLLVLSNLLPTNLRTTYLDDLMNALDQDPLFRLGIVSAPFAEGK